MGYFQPHENVTSNMQGAESLAGQSSLCTFDYSFYPLRDIGISSSCLSLSNRSSELDILELVIFAATFVAKQEPDEYRNLNGRGIVYTNSMSCCSIHRVTLGWLEVFVTYVGRTEMTIVSKQLGNARVPDLGKE